MYLLLPSGQNLNSFTVSFRSGLLHFVCIAFTGLVLLSAWPSIAISSQQTKQISPPGTGQRSASAGTNVTLEADLKIKKLETDLKAQPKNIQIISALGTEYFQKNDFEKCTQLLWKNIDLLDRKTLLILSQAHMKKKEYSEVIRTTQMIISKNEKDEQALTLLGNAHFLAGREKQALENYKKATDANGTYEPAYEGLVQLYEKRNNYYELRILYQDMMEKMGERPLFLTKLCEINTKDTLNDHALEYCKRAIQRSPETPENHVNLGIIYKNQGETLKALEKLKSTAQKFPKSIYAQISYAQFAEEKSDFLDAFKFYTLCVNLDEQGDLCLVGQGLAAAQIRKPEQAFESLKKACFKNRKNASAVRKTIVLMKNLKLKDWVARFEALADKCMSQ